MNRVPLLYMLHSGNLYGTERMALATAEGLADEFQPVILAPAGPALGEARKMGFETKSFASAQELAGLIRPVFSVSRKVAVIATGVVHSLCAIALSRIYNRQMAHLHVVHGGTDERLSYGRKRWLNHSSAVLVAVSTFVKERLMANGVDDEKVEVIENFLPLGRTEKCCRRKPYVQAGIRKALVISRVDPIKRIDVLLSALEQQPALSGLTVRVLGTGWSLEALRERAAQSFSNVNFAGFVDDVEKDLSETDLLIHLCPAEPFGLAILEAIAAGVPALVPDSGGAGSLVEDGISGFRFRANDPSALAKKLLEIKNTCACDLNRIAANADGLLRTRFSAAARIHDYRALLHKGLSL